MRVHFGLAASLLVLALGACRTSPNRARTGPAATSEQVSLDIMVFEVPPDGQQLFAFGAGAPGASPRVLSAAAVDGFWQEVRRTPSVASVSAPKILALSGQEASTMSGEVARVGGWSGVKTWATPRVERGQVVSLDLRVEKRNVDGTELRAEAPAARLRSGESMLVLGTGDASRLLVLVSATVLRAAP